MKNLYLVIDKNRDGLYNNQVAGATFIFRSSSAGGSA